LQNSLSVSRIHISDSTLKLSCLVEVNKLAVVYPTACKTTEKQTKEYIKAFIKTTNVIASYHKFLKATKVPDKYGSSFA